MSTADITFRALRRGMVILLVTALVRSLVFLRSNADVYSPAAPAWTAYALLIAVTLAVAWFTTGPRTLDGVRGALTATTLLASALATAAVPTDRLLTSTHWSWYIVGWFLVAIHVGKRFRLLGWSLALNLVLVLVQVRLTGPLDRRDVAELLIRGFLFTGAQLAFGLAWRVASRAERAADQIREREARALTEDQIAEEVLADQRRRHSTVAVTTIPLLEGLADGTLSPDDPVVRRRSMVEATRLRRLMAESDRSPNPLTHELQACVDVAERSGLQVEVAFRGAAASPGLAARRRLTEPVIAVLAAARGLARVTVVGTGQDVVVSVLADLSEDGGAVPETFLPDRAGDDDVAVTVVRSPGRIWVTARWEAA